jgi:endoglucanase
MNVFPTVIEIRLPRLLATTLLMAAALLQTTVSAASWPQWEAYKRHFMQQDGRVIEHSQDARTTSEAQAYALFHALVANDRKTFQRTLDWTEHNLAAGDLTQQLPAWLWGKRPDGSWGIIDDNAASDADMWLAWVLLEAGEKWRSEHYRKLGHSVLSLIERHEIVRLPQLGYMVLPGPHGFHPDKQSWKLNLSYLPLQVIRKFSRSGNREIWNDVLRNSITLISRATTNGIVPDWVIYAADGTLRADAKSPSNRIGFDAIRVYLWAGMLPPSEPGRAALLQKLSRACAEQLVPDASTSAGMKIAIAPLMKTTGNNHCVGELVKLVDRSWHGGLLGDPARYYDQNLSMFALAWLEKRYAFTADGGLLTAHHETD